VSKILNLYAGVGGQRRDWSGHEITAVENQADIAAVYQRLYPNDLVVVGDAHQYLLDHYSEFDFIWASPPCQSHSRMIRSGRNRKPRYPDMDLYSEILFLTHNFDGKWVVENVKPYYTPLIPAQALGRHLVWSNFIIQHIEPPTFKGFISKQNMAARAELQDWLGIHFEEKIYCGENHDPTQVLRNCLHGDVGRAILDDAMKADFFDVAFGA
jgi:DNA (cytosine-5)-methyltransferase 1